MYAIEIQIKRANLTSRAHARLMKRINQRVMERQWNERVPNHFEIAAYSEYNARPRATKYTATKLRAKGHNRPNVFTGRLQKSLRHKITATQFGAKLIMRAKLPDRLPADEWAKLTPKQQAAENRKRRRLAQWQKQEIAVLSRKEIRDERKRMASEYRHGALSPEFKRQRQRRIK